jgi:hypothetical protein
MRWRRSARGPWRRKSVFGASVNLGCLNEGFGGEKDEPRGSAHTEGVDGQRRGHVAQIVDPRRYCRVGARLCGCHWSGARDDG